MIPQCRALCGQSVSPSVSFYSTFVCVETRLNAAPPARTRLPIHAAAAYTSAHAASTHVPKMRREKEKEGHAHAAQLPNTHVAAQRPSRWTADPFRTYAAVVPSLFVTV